MELLLTLEHLLHLLPSRVLLLLLWHLTGWGNWHTGRILRYFTASELGPLLWPIIFSEIWFSKIPFLANQLGRQFSIFQVTTLFQFLNSLLLFLNLIIWVLLFVFGKLLIKLVASVTPFLFQDVVQFIVDYFHNSFHQEAICAVECNSHRLEILLLWNFINVLRVQLHWVERWSDWTHWFVDKANHTLVLETDDILDVQQLLGVFGVN